MLKVFKYLKAKCSHCYPNYTIWSDILSKTLGFQKFLCICKCMVPEFVYGINPEGVWERQLRRKARRAPGGYLGLNKKEQSLAAISAQGPVMQTALHGEALVLNCLSALCFCHLTQLLQRRSWSPISTTRTETSSI